MMKNIIKNVCLIGFAVMIMLLSVSCKQSLKINVNYTTQIINSYESYDDLRKTSIFGNIYGEVTLTNDSSFVTEGNQSAKFALDHNSEYGSVQQKGDKIKIGDFKFETHLYDSKFSQLSTIKEFKIDIYNDSTEEYELYFVATKDKSKTFFTQGTVLASKSWNYVTFEVKPYFFTKDDIASEYKLYIGNLDKMPEKKATFYIDNFRAEILTEKAAAPAFDSSKEIHFNGIEILNFNNFIDLDYILTNRNVESEYLLPLFYTKFDAINGGRLRAELNISNLNNDVWATGNGYDISIHESVLKNIIKPKSISVLCENPSTDSHYVSLITTSGSEKMLVKKYIPAGEIVFVEVQDINLKNITSLIIRIDSWNLTDRSTLYFSNLKYKI